MSEGKFKEFPDIFTVLPACGIELPPASNKANISVKCPFCDDKKRHLRFSVETKQFFCPRCSASGNILTFYARIHNISNEEAYKILTSDSFSSSSSVSLPQRKPTSLPPSAPLACVEQRDTVYSALLALLSLKEEHRKDLLERGLSLEQIEKNRYKSMPYGKSISIPAQLLKKGLSLKGVPGFYVDSLGRWRFRCTDKINGKPVHPGMSGYLIPVLDSKGRIQGLQLRREKDAHPKYIWLSTADYNMGCGAKTWCHYVGTPLSSRTVKDVILTEGALKADVINCLSGHSVLAIMGVNSVSELKNALERLRISGVQRISIAFDMDMQTNPNVKRAFENLKKLLDEKKFAYRTLYWEKYKGLDDYLLHIKQKSAQ